MKYPSMYIPLIFFGTWLVIVSVVFILGRVRDPRCSSKLFTSHVVLVGGCDKYGYCSAFLEDGTVLRSTFKPVSGAPPAKDSCNEEER